MPVLAATPDVLDRGRAVLEAAFGPGPQRVAAGPKGPPQPPWDELPGMTFTREMVGDLTPDDLGRDDYSTDRRVRAYDWLRAAYDLNRHAPTPVPIWQPPGLYILSGDQGDGKTLVAVDVAVLFVICGWPSYSVNGGLCFSKIMEPHQVYSFADHVTRGGMVFVDEVPNVYGRYEGKTVRGQTMAQSTAAFRKEYIWAFGATSREWMIGSDLKAAVRGIGYPHQTYPIDGVGYQAPDWAYRAVEWYYPDPFRGQQFREQFDKNRQHREPIRMGETYHDPHQMARAAQHYVSWEKIVTDFGGHMSAEAFRAAQDAADQVMPTDEAIGLHVLGWVEDGVFESEVASAAAYQREGKSLQRGPHVLHIEDLAKRFETERGAKVGVTGMGRALRAVGAEPSSRQRVSVLALLDAVAERKQGTARALWGEE